MTKIEQGKLSLLEAIDENLFDCGWWGLVNSFIWWLDILKGENFDSWYFFRSLSGGMVYTYDFSHAGSPWEIQKEKDELGLEWWEEFCRNDYEWNKFGV